MTKMNNLANVFEDIKITHFSDQLSRAIVSEI